MEKLWFGEKYKYNKSPSSWMTDATRNSRASKLHEPLPVRKWGRAEALGFMHIIVSVHCQWSHLGFYSPIGTLSFFVQHLIFYRFCSPSSSLNTPPCFCSFWPKNPIKGPFLGMNFSFISHFMRCFRGNKSHCWPELE